MRLKTSFAALSCTAALAASAVDLTNVGEIVYGGGFTLSGGTVVLQVKRGKANARGISRVSATLALPEDKTLTLSGRLDGDANEATLAKRNKGSLALAFGEDDTTGTYTDAEGVAAGFSVPRISPRFTSLTGLEKMRVGVLASGSVALDDTSSLVRYSASKLPIGLKLASATGVITGIPRKATSGTATVKARCRVATDGLAKTVATTVSATFPWSVDAMDSWAYGNFTAEGIKLKIAKTGRITGKLACDGTWYRVSEKSYTGYSDGTYFCEGSGKDCSYIIAVTASGLAATLVTASGTAALATFDGGSTSASTGEVAGDGLSYTYQIASAHGKTLTYAAEYVANGSGTFAISNATISATGANTIGVLAVNGAQVTLVNCTIVKSGDGSGQSNGDDYNFYGVNNAVVALGPGTSITLDNCTVTTSAEYANAVFASDNGTVTIRNGITITTSGGSSRGLFASYGGTVQAPDGGVDITTSGSHCAALATDRGGGTVICGASTTAAASTLSTQRNDSPCIYSTGSITACNLTGSCAEGQAVVVEGKNEVSLANCAMTGGRVGQGCIFLYQSSSGDAADSDASATYSVFYATNCTFTAANSADMIVCTHTTARAYVEDCTFYADAAMSPFATSGASQYLINAETVNASQWGSGNYLTVSTPDDLVGTVYAGDSTSSVTVTCGGGSSLAQSNDGGTIAINP